MTLALLLKPEQAAKSLGISRTALYNMLRDGSLDSVKIGRSRRISAEALESFVERLRAEARDDAGESGE